MGDNIEHDISKKDEPTLLQIGTSCSHGKCMQSTLAVRRSKPRSHGQEVKAEVTRSGGQSRGHTIKRSSPRSHGQEVKAEVTRSGRQRRGHTIRRSKPRSHLAEVSFGEPSFLTSLGQVNFVV